MQSSLGSNSRCEIAQSLRSWMTRPPQAGVALQAAALVKVNIGLFVRARKLQKCTHSAHGPMLVK